MQVKQISIEAINLYPQSTQFCDEAQEVSDIDSSGIAVLEYLWRMSEQRQGIEDYFRHSPTDHLPELLIEGYFPICKNCLPVRMMTEQRLSSGQKPRGIWRYLNPEDESECFRGFAFVAI